MKKSRSILSVLLILAVLTASACTSNDPKEVYAEMAEAFREAAQQKGVKLGYDCSLKLSDSGRTSTYSLNGDVAFKTDENTQVTELEQRGDLKIDMNVGTLAAVPVRAYYVDGTLYSEINESRYKKQMDAEAALAQIGPMCMPVIGLDADDFKELTLKDNEDGTRTVSMMIAAGAAGKITGLVESWRRLAKAGEQEGTVEFQDVRGFFVLQDGMPVQQSLTIIGTVKTPEKTCNITEELVLAISAENAVTVAQPADSQFAALD